MPDGTWQVLGYDYGDGRVDWQVQAAKKWEERQNMSELRKTYERLTSDIVRKRLES